MVDKKKLVKELFDGKADLLENKFYELEDKLDDYTKEKIGKVINDLDKDNIDFISKRIEKLCYNRRRYGIVWKKKHDKEHTDNMNRLLFG